LGESLQDASSSMCIYHGLPPPSVLKSPKAFLQNRSDFNFFLNSSSPFGAPNDEICKGRYYPRLRSLFQDHKTFVDCGSPHDRTSMGANSPCLDTAQDRVSCCILGPASSGHLFVHFSEANSFLPAARFLGRDTNRSCPPLAARVMVPLVHRTAPIGISWIARHQSASCPLLATISRACFDVNRDI
jgi:hypothetical protein